MFKNKKFNLLSHQIDYHIFYSPVSTILIDNGKGKYNVFE